MYITTDSLGTSWDDAVLFVNQNQAYEPSMLRKGTPVHGLVNTYFNLYKKANDSVQMNVKTPKPVQKKMDSQLLLFAACKANTILRDVVTDKATLKNIGFVENYQKLKEECRVIVSNTILSKKWIDFQKDGDMFFLQYRNDNVGKPDFSALHEITLPIDHPFWQRYFPMNDWHCSATVVQVKKSKYPETDSNIAFENAEIVDDLYAFNSGIDHVLLPPKLPYFECSAEVQQYFKF